MGKTTIASNLGIVLSERGERVLLVDADLPSGNLAHHLNIEDPIRTLCGFLSGDIDSIEEAMIDVNENLDLLASKSSLREFLDSDVEKLEEDLPTFAERYDLAIIDCPPGISKNSLTPMEISDQMVLVLTADEASIGSAENIEKIGNLVDIDTRGYILNRWRERSLLSRLFSSGTQVEKELIEERMASKPIGTVPEDENVRKATEVGRPVVQYDENTGASKAIKEIGENF